MNYILIFNLIGNMLKIEGALMLVPLAVSFIYRGEDAAAFGISAVVTAALGFGLTLLKPASKKFKSNDAFAAAALSWIIFSVLGALPFYFYSRFGGGFNPAGFNSIADCVFESVSGFTTTGATILSDIESLPRGILFWRSFSHWIGGMGVLVFILAVTPSSNASSINLLRAESTGPLPGKFTPKIRETALIMYLIYLAMTAVLTVLLLVAGMPVYDALIHGFSTAGTGGFSNMNASVGAYGNTAAEVIITVFMFLFGVNFSLYFFLVAGKIKRVFGDEEFRLYLIIVAASVAVVTVNIAGLYNTVAEALKHSSFQVAAVITSAGFSTADYMSWPPLSQSVLLLLMFTGSCAGSTAGGIKLVRIMLLFRSARTVLNRITHPRGVHVVTINGRKIGDEVVSGVGIFLFVYFVIFLSATILISIDGHDILTNASAVIAMLGNVGPGLGDVGPAGNYAEFSSSSKIVMSACMIMGRLEIFPVLILIKSGMGK